ncbi:MAG TPA: FHA domain-containing protein, partial [Byssovorax sp.]
MKVQRVVTPTPPSGMPKVELPIAPTPPPRAVEAAGASVAPMSRAGDRKSRPEAPVFSFAPPLPEPPRSRPPPPDDGAAARLNGATCTDCGGMNPPNYRFCMTCGATLAAEGAPRAQTSGGAHDMKPGVVASAAQNLRAPPPPAPSRTPPTANVDLGARMDKTHPPPPTDEARRFAQEQPIVASRVVAIAPGAPQAPAKLVACSRCHGHCVAGTRFCKYCGAPLDETKLASEPAPAPPQSVRAPAVKRLDPPPQPAPEPARSAVPAPERPAPPPRRDSPAPFPRPAVEKKAPTNAGPALRARLTVIVEDGSEGRSFPLDDQQVDVGRTEGAVRLEDDPYVSPRHARFLREGNA